MRTIKITAADVREYLGVSRSELQRWLKAIPPFSSQAISERHARYFCTRDLAFLYMINVLIKHVGLRAEIVATFSSSLYDSININPFTAASDRSELRIALSENGNWEVTSNSRGVLTVLLDIQVALQAVHDFLGVNETDAQRELPLGLVMVNKPGLASGSRR